MLQHTKKTPSLFGMLGIGIIVLALALLSIELEPVQLLVILVGLLGTIVVLKYPFSGLFLLVFLVQLSAIVERIVPSGLAMEGLVVLTIAGVIINLPGLPRKIRWGKSSAAFRMACLFILTAGVSAMFSDYPSNAMLGLVKLIGMLVVFFLVLILVQTPQRVKALLFAIMLSTFISTGIANIGHLTGYIPLGLDTVSVSSHQAGASNISSTTSANMMLVGTVIAALLALRSTKWRLFYVLVAVTGVSGIIFTFTRSALMLLVLGCAWIAIKFRKARHFPAVIILFALLSISMLPLLPQHLWDRFESIGDPGADWTLGRRLGYHKVGFDLLAQNPLLGVGPGNFGQHYIGYDYRWIEGRQLESRALHNMYLSVAAETGLLGFSFFSAMIVISLIGLNRTRKSAHDPELRMLAEAIQFGYVLFLIAAGSLPAVTNKYTWILISLSVAVSLIAQQPARQHASYPVKSEVDPENALHEPGQPRYLGKHLDNL
jgi:O-antigen ligase